MVWYQTVNAYKNPFVTLQDHVTEEVINGKEVLFVADLNRFYEELVNLDESDVSHNARKLEGKIMNYFGDRIQRVRAKTIRGNLICDKKYITDYHISRTFRQRSEMLPIF